jgi:electron transfer flavoprotein beta subunit
MRILVPTKRVPDPDQPVLVRPDGAGLDEDRLSFVLNPFDAIALEEALRLRERLPGPVEVLAVGVGGPAYDNQLRTALAMGADRALLVACDAPPDPWNVARVLAALVRKEAPDLVLMGKQAVDDDANQAGQFLAALLDWPQATFASRIELDGAGPGAAARVTRETDAGLETVRVRLPAVITADLRLNEPRYASLPSIMKARKKPIERLGLQDLGVAPEPRVEVLRLEPVASQRSCVRVKDVEDLVGRLRHEAKVL